MKKVLLLGLIFVLGLQSLSAMKPNNPLFSGPEIGLEEVRFEEMPSLHAAAQRGDLVELKRLVDAGVDVNVPWQNKMPLEYAFAALKIESVKFLLSNGVNIPNVLFMTGYSGRDPDGAAKHREILNLLTRCKYVLDEVGGVLNIYDLFANDPISRLPLPGKIASLCGCVNFKINGRFLLHEAIVQLLFLSKPYEGVIRALLDNGADICLCDNNGLNALHSFFIYEGINPQDFRANIPVLSALLGHPNALRALQQKSVTKKNRPCNSGPRRAISPFSFAKFAADENPELNQIMQEFSTQNGLDWKSYF